MTSRHPRRALVPAASAVGITETDQVGSEPSTDLTERAPVGTPLSKRWNSCYLSLGLGRSLPKVAQEIADLRLMEREGYRLDPRQGHKRSADMRKAIAKLRETDPLWTNQYRSAKNRVSIWSFRYGWVAVAQAHDAQMLSDTLREWQAKELEMRSRHFDTAMALELQGATDYLTNSKNGRAGATAAVQTVGLGVQLQRSALNLMGGKGVQVQTLASLMADLTQPANHDQAGALDSPPQQGDVTITQVNTTNNTLVVQPHNSRPWTCCASSKPTKPSA